MKKISLGIIFAALICICILPVTAFAESERTVTETGYCGENVTYTLYSDGELIISGEGDMNDYDYVHERSPFFNNHDITSLIVKNGVTSIGEYAFRDCSSLTEITIPEGVTSIGSSAFGGCSSLAEITIPEGVTSIGRYAFSDCSSLTEITIPGSLTRIDEDVFFICSSITDVYFTGDLEDWCNINFESASSNPLSDHAANLYINGELLTNVVVPDSITAIGNATFIGCTSLTSVTIHENVTSIGDTAFTGCFSLFEITIPENVTSIGRGAFSACFSLAEITIPEGVTSIGEYAFSYCSSLAEITIPEGVTSIGDYAFGDCSSLADVYYTGTQEQWQNIDISIDNEYLTNANIHYNYVIHEHEFSIWEYLNTYSDIHFCKCSICGKTDYKSFTEHQDSNGDRFCDVCGYEMTEEIPENPENPDEEPGSNGFFDSIADFFKRIIEFFRNIFSKIFG